jgi:Gas vesicle synthesis protein GvpL/GvpF
MSLVAHAITASPAAAFERRGLRGRALSASEADGLLVWTTEWESGTRLERDDAFDHHRVVERICEAQPCLPVRFGTVFADDVAARQAIVPKVPDLRAALARVSGMSELAITLLWRGQPSAVAAQQPADDDLGPGRRFMEERRADLANRDRKRRRADDLAERLVAELAIDRALVWHETCTTEDVAVSLAALVPSERAAERKRDMERFVVGFPDVVGVVNGPWPPYSFAKIE